ncbi:MAG: SIS domain-containing protein [Proteobacteria bacterium]|nr:SIS domain-containing protein [Pseudomonadota bacterium]
MSVRDPAAAELERRGARWTATEIDQQPAVWAATESLLRAGAASLRAFLDPLLARPDLRLILTGAGSSAFIGRCLQPALAPLLDRRVEAIATTEIVAAPRRCLQPGAPTLLVSFARSGSSPESLAATELADHLLPDVHHLIVTCNPEGELRRRHERAARSRVLLLPEASHDRGFAMTSSFSAMLYAAHRALAPAVPLDAGALGAAAAGILADRDDALATLAGRDFRRVVYLGSATLAGLADEAALKLLELTDGEVAAIANSPLGFRHGPKTFVNRSTLVVVLASGEPLTRRYDLDLAREVTADGLAGRVLVLSPAANDLAGLDTVRIAHPGAGGDVALLFPYLAFAQRLALLRSLALGLTPDTPSRSGSVSRVVKGVTIHRLAEGD